MISLFSFNSLSIFFILSSNSPRYFVPATKAAKSNDKIRLFNKSFGTRPSTICCARPSIIAVFPTPGSPVNTGLFLVLRDKI